MSDDFMEGMQEQLLSLHAANILLKARVSALSAILEGVIKHTGYECGSGMSFQVAWSEITRQAVDQVLKQMADDFPHQASQIARILAEDQI